MIRIAEKKLIIEIDTFNQHPLAALDDLKNGFVHLLSTVPYMQLKVVVNLTMLQKECTAFQGCFRPLCLAQINLLLLVKI